MTGYSLIYHPDRQMVIFNNGADGSYRSWTWGYDGQWHLLAFKHGPQASVDGSLVFDTQRSALVQFGGSDNIGFISRQTWELADSDKVFILQQPSPASVVSNQVLRVSFAVLLLGTVGAIGIDMVRSLS